MSREAAAARGAAPAPERLSGARSARAEAGALPAGSLALEPGGEARPWAALAAASAPAVAAGLRAADHGAAGPVGSCGESSAQLRPDAAARPAGSPRAAAAAGWPRADRSDPIGASTFGQHRAGSRDAPEPAGTVGGSPGPFGPDSGSAARPEPVAVRPASVASDHDQALRLMARERIGRTCEPGIVAPGPVGRHGDPLELVGRAADAADCTGSTAVTAGPAVPTHAPGRDVWAEGAGEDPVPADAGAQRPARSARAAPPAAPHDRRSGRIGPNAIIRALEALRAARGEAVSCEVLRAAGLIAYADAAPTAMVDEAEVVRLHVAIAALLGDEDQATIAAESGRLTGRYLLAHRIPSAARVVLRALPAGLALPLLRRSIARHAWTFAGSGRFAWPPGDAIRLSGGPFALHPEAATLLAPFYAATFETLLRALVDPRLSVTADADTAPDPGLRLQLRH